MSGSDSVRGAGVSRPGATDTTMLIWKVIHANPGITRDEIFARVEQQIPEGWAKRRYATLYKIPSDRLTSGGILGRARREMLTLTLQKMRRYGSIERGDGGGYKTRREIRRYQGNPDAVDETGTRAADHLNAAYALPKAEAAVARVNPENPRPTKAEWEAIVRVVKQARNVARAIAS